MTLTRKELSITDAKNDNLFYLINATCHKFTGKADHLIVAKYESRQNRGGELEAVS